MGGQMTAGTAVSRAQGAQSSICNVSRRASRDAHRDLTFAARHARCKGQHEAHWSTHPAHTMLLLRLQPEPHRACVDDQRGNIMQRQVVWCTAERCAASLWPIACSHPPCIPSRQHPDEAPTAWRTRYGITNGLEAHCWSTGAPVGVLLTVAGLQGRETVALASRRQCAN
jgi:hypothetical protein